MKILKVEVFSILFLFFALHPSFLESQPKWKGKIVYENGVKVVKNPAEPFYGEWKFELEKDLVIGEKEESSLFASPRDVKIDSAGNIYILDPKAYKIHKFSKEGKYLLSMGRKGEGPGEFVLAFDFHVDKRGNVFVFDFSGRKIIIFDPSGNFINQIKIGKIITTFSVNDEGRIFSLIYEWDEKSMTYLSFHWRFLQKV